MRSMPIVRRIAAASSIAATLALVSVLVATPGKGEAKQAAGQDRPVTAIIVRHAERATTHPTDPPLDSIGRVRAAALRETLEDAGVSAIYVTQYRRTHETAQPLADALGLEPREIGVAGGADVHAQAVATALLSRHRGEVVLVVGHSNTIGRIARALGAAAPVELGDTEYAHL